MATKIETSKLQDSHIIVNNSLTLLARRLVLLGFNGVLIIFLPRYLGAEGLGQLAFATSFAGLFVAAMSLGFEKYLIKRIARDRTQIGVYLSNSIGIRLVTCLIFFGVVLGFANLTGYSTGAKQVMYLAAATAVGTSFARLMTSVPYGMEDMGWPAMAETFAKLLVVVVGVTILVLGFRTVAYASVLLAASLVYFGLIAAYVGRRAPLRVSFRAATVKDLIVGGMPFLFMLVLLDVYNEIDTVMVRFFTTEAVVGWYAAANRLYHTVDMLPMVLTTALLPTLARMRFTDLSAVTSIVKKCISVGALVIVPVALGISLLSNEIITALPYPDSFQNSVPLLTILALTIPPTSFLILLGTVAIALDRQKVWAIALLGTVALNVILNALAIPYYQQAYGNGGIGAAATTLLCECIMVVVGVWLMPRGVIDRGMVINLLKIVFAGGVMVLVGLLVRRLGLGTAPLVAIGVLTYGVLVLATGAATIKDLGFISEMALARIRGAKAEAPP